MKRLLNLYCCVTVMVMMMFTACEQEQNASTDVNIEGKSSTTTTTTVKEGVFSTTSSTTTSTTTSTTVIVEYTTVQFSHDGNATGSMGTETFASWDGEHSLTPYKLPYCTFQSKAGYEFYAWSVSIGNGNPRLYQPNEYIVYSSLTSDFLAGAKVIYVTAIYHSVYTTTTSIKTVENNTPQYFWGTWVKMSDGVEYNIYETVCEYNNNIKYMSSCTDTTLSIQGLGTFTKQSDSVMVMDNIPYYRKGGANLEYKVRVVGFSDSRAGGTLGQADKRVIGKSQKYNSYISETQTDKDGVATLIAPTVNDMQTVTVENDNGVSVSVSDICVERSGANMGTIALVNANQPNLKVTGEIMQSESQTDEYGYLYAGQTYSMILTIKNISEVVSKTSIVSVIPDDGLLTATVADGTNLSSGIVVGSLAAGGVKTFVLTVRCSDIARGHIDTGLNVTINNVLDNQIWEDYVPMRFFKEKAYWTITAKNPDNNDDAVLKGFIIYPDGNNQYFTVANNGVKTIEVPQFNLDEQYLMVFCGANANTGLYSTEMHYSVVCGHNALPIDEDIAQIVTKITFGESNDNQDSAFVVNDPFQAYLHAGDIDYYNVTANDNNIITVTLDNQSADTSGTEIVCGSLGVALPDITIPTRTGYTFGGYWTEPNGVGTQYIFSNGSGACVVSAIEELTLYAKWTPITYTVVYENNGGSGSMETQSMTYDVSADLKSGTSFSKTGYTFLGWDLDQNAAEPTWTAYQTVSNLTTIDGATVRLYAVWQPHSYTVAFDANGGTGDAMASQSMTYGTPTSLSACTFTKDGYSFAGWSKTQNADVADYDDGEAVSDISSVNGGYVTLYAVWGVNYTVHFDANGGEGSMDDQGMIGKKSTVLNTNMFTRTGYTFVGWSREIDAENPTYMDKLSVIDLSNTIGDVVTLYAVWNAIKYTVMFNSNGGSGTMSDKIMTYDLTDNLSANTFVKTGYVFAGWSDEQNAVTVIWADGQQVTNLSTIANKVVELYAIWQPITYTVTFNPNGGTGIMNDMDMTYDVVKALPANMYINANNMFIGWSATDSDTSVLYTDKMEITNLTVVNGTTVILYAVWKDSFILPNGNMQIKGVEYENTSFVQVMESEKIVIGSDENWNSYLSSGNSSLIGEFIDGRNVKLSPYCMGKYEVTQQLYEAVMQTGRTDTNVVGGQKYEYGYGNNYPAYYVSWYDAIAFCNKLSLFMGKTPCYNVSGISDWEDLLYSSIPVNSSNTNWNAVTVNMSANGYRLPTQAEWEFAARGGDQNKTDWKFAFAGMQSLKNIFRGDIENDSDYGGANHKLEIDNNLDIVGWYTNNSSSVTHPVGSKTANRLGLYDMSGNVWEWCWDWYWQWYDQSVTSNDNSYIIDGVVTNPLGTVSGTKRCLRGGGYLRAAYYCAVSFRGQNLPYERNNHFGLRLVCSVR